MYIFSKGLTHLYLISWGLWEDFLFEHSSERGGRVGCLKMFLSSRTFVQRGNGIRTVVASEFAIRAVATRLCGSCREVALKLCSAEEVSFTVFTWTGAAFCLFWRRGGGVVCFGAALMACRSSWARDQTHATKVTRATAVTTLDR